MRREFDDACAALPAGDDGVVRNTIYVRRTEPTTSTSADDRPAGVVGWGGVDGRRIDEEEFASVSLQVLSACWTSDNRLWLQRRKAGKFLSSSRAGYSGSSAESRQLARGKGGKRGCDLHPSGKKQTRFFTAKNK